MIKNITYTKIGTDAGAGANAPAVTTAGGELIAIFAAAIAQMAGVTGAPPPRVISYRKTGQSAPVWNLRGRNEYLSEKL